MLSSEDPENQEHTIELLEFSLFQRFSTSAPSGHEVYGFEVPLRQKVLHFKFLERPKLQCNAILILRRGHACNCNWKLILQKGPALTVICFSFSLVYYFFSFFFLCLSFFSLLSFSLLSSHFHLSSCSSLFTSLHVHLSSSSSSSPSLFISVSLYLSLSSFYSLTISFFIALACEGFKKERILCVQLSVGSPNLAIHNACHVSLFPLALFEPAQTTTVSDRPSSPSFQQSRPHESYRTVPC